VSISDSAHHQYPATVVFVHALWLRGISLLLQARRVARCGFDVDCAFSYASVTGTLAVHARRLAEHIAQLDSPCVHLVGHSMGTLVILKMLAESRDPRIGRIVLLGPPYHGSLAGRTVGALLPLRWLLGHSYALWSRRETVPPPCNVDVGVIAGTVPVGLGTLLGVLTTPHDGVVMVEETRVPGARDHICLDVSHTGMIVAPVVADQVCAFLEHGHFQRIDARAEVA
jgi:Alpha/beta hydrolase family